MELVLYCIIHLPEWSTLIPWAVFCLQCSKVLTPWKSGLNALLSFPRLTCTLSISLSGSVKLKDVICCSILALILGRSLLKLIPKLTWPDKLFFPLISCQKNYYFFFYLFFKLSCFSLVFVDECINVLLPHYLLPLTLVLLESSFLAADDQALTVSIFPLV